ncbi:MAG TPA: nuclear transport factor 2 family protein [Solirubrobacteraceae bacterium]|jgi:ketosteroid isomerase-like protein|nr:nuclear transport factor 2 family protein [Solirubrobacteraceae bacterium]
MEEARAHAFVRDWVDSWNRHDVDEVLAHSADEVTFTSPVAARIVEDSEGVIRGKQALRAHWTAGIRLISNVHFDLIDVYVGVDTLTIK